MFSRLFLVALMLAVQLATLFSGAIYFSQTILYLYMLFVLMSIVSAINVVSNGENPSYKITWIVAILFFPSIGWLFYLLFGHKRMPAKLQKRIDASQADARMHIPANDALEEKLRSQSESLAVQSRYIYNSSGYPLMQDIHAEYYSVGEEMFPRMLEELRRAERYIFMEYFIIHPGKMWDAVFAILKEKAAAGVEVRLMYDDLGSINTMPKKYGKTIREAGIRLLVFNPFRPRISVILNHRDHRKIMVIDGKTAFCGGINIADEYINEVDRFGHWKDTGVLLKGRAAWAFAFMFLQQWQFETDEPIEFRRYWVKEAPCPERDEAVHGLVQPFGDSPLDDFNVTESAYLGIISRATRYIYITTPYLVIGYEMETALCCAAQSGLDVRIITPHRYDKWYVHVLTRSHYARLVKAGVKIYEYTPGFMHGKMCVSDDHICMVGTCNMDFRSFYLHFECSVLFYYSDIVEKVKEDILACQKISQMVTWEEMQKEPLATRLCRAVLKLFAPLM